MAMTGIHITEADITGSHVSEKYETVNGAPIRILAAREPGPGQNEDAEGE